MLTIQRLSACTFEQAVQAWNEGSQEYKMDVTMNVSRFTARLGLEGLSPEHSLIAFVDGEPAGVLLNGFRTINGKKVAWNGGTGVSPRYRGQGVGKALLERTFEIYREEQVDVATLEALDDNERAIGLYRQMGYEIVDHLAFYSQTEELKRDPYRYLITGDYQVKRGIPQDVQHLPFYQTMGAWQTQWPSVRDGESLIVYDAEGEAIGYAIFKRRYNEAGVQDVVLVMQVGWDPTYTDIDDLIRFLYSEVFEFDLPLKRTVVNFPASYQRAVRWLLGAGFAKSAAQVLMMKSMRGSAEEHLEEGTVDAESFT